MTNTKGERSFITFEKRHGNHADIPVSEAVATIHEKVNNQIPSPQHLYSLILVVLQRLEYMAGVLKGAEKLSLPEKQVFFSSGTFVFNTFGGVCDNLSRYTTWQCHEEDYVVWIRCLRDTVLGECFKSWGGFSGNLIYPVLNGRESFHDHSTARLYFWTGDQLEARTSLINHMISVLGCVLEEANSK